MLYCIKLLLCRNFVNFAGRTAGVKPAPTSARSKPSGGQSNAAKDEEIEQLNAEVSVEMGGIKCLMVYILLLPSPLLSFFIMTA